MGADGAAGFGGEAAGGTAWGGGGGRVGDVREGARPRGAEWAAEGMGAGGAALWPLPKGRATRAAMASMGATGCAAQRRRLRAAPATWSRGRGVGPVGGRHLAAGDDGARASRGCRGPARGRLLLRPPGVFGRGGGERGVFAWGASGGVGGCLARGGGEWGGDRAAAGSGASLPANSRPSS